MQLPDHFKRNADCKHIYIALVLLRQKKCYANQPFKIMERSKLQDAVGKLQETVDRLKKKVDEGFKETFERLSLVKPSAQGKKTDWSAEIPAE